MDFGSRRVSLVALIITPPAASLRRGFGRFLSFCHHRNPIIHSSYPGSPGRLRHAHPNFASPSGSSSPPRNTNAAPNNPRHSTPLVSKSQEKEDNQQGIKGGFCGVPTTTANSDDTAVGPCKKQPPIAAQRTSFQLAGLLHCICRKGKSTAGASNDAAPSHCDTSLTSVLEAPRQARLHEQQQLKRFPLFWISTAQNHTWTINHL